MNKKRKIKKKKTRPLPQLSAEEKNLLDYLLSNLKKINLNKIKDQIHSQDFARTLIERLPADDEASVKVLMAIRDTFDSKDIQKAIRKAIFRLKRNGIDIPDQEEEKESTLIFSKPESDEPRAYLGPIDGTGSRGVLIMLPQIPRDVDVGIGVTSSEAGITYFICDRCSKKRARELKDLFFQQTGKAVKTSLSHAATVMEHAYKKNELSTVESSGDYLKLRPWILENVSLLSRPAVSDFIRPEDHSEDILTESEIKRLLEHELMETWIITPENIQPVLEEIFSVEESPIIISEGQKKNRINEIKEKAVRDLFPNEERLRVKGDLEEMAYVFFKLGDEVMSHLSMATAYALDDQDSIIRINPFLRVYLERSLDYFMDIMQENGEPEDDEDDLSPMIITP